MLYDAPSRTFWHTPQLLNIPSERLGQSSSVPKHVGEPKCPATHLLGGHEYGYREIPVPNNRNYFGKIAPPRIVEGNPNRTFWEGSSRFETTLQLIYGQEAVTAFLKPPYDAREMIS
jgi:hypothetical protein